MDLKDGMQSIEKNLISLKIIIKMFGIGQSMMIIK